MAKPSTSFCLKAVTWREAQAIRTSSPPSMMHQMKTAISRVLDDERPVERGQPRQVGQSGQEPLLDGDEEEE